MFNIKQFKDNDEGVFYNEQTKELILKFTPEKNTIFSNIYTSTYEQKQFIVNKFFMRYGQYLPYYERNKYAIEVFDTANMEPYKRYFNGEDMFCYQEATKNSGVGIFVPFDLTEDLYRKAIINTKDTNFSNMLCQKAKYRKDELEFVWWVVAVSLAFVVILCVLGMVWL